MTPLAPQTETEKDKEDLVLVLAPMGRDASLTANILSSAGLDTQVCETMEDLARETRVGAGCALLTEEALSSSDVRVLARALRRQPPWSDFPLIIFTSRGDITHARVRTLSFFEGFRNVTFFERPVRIMTLVSVVHAALAARRRQYEVRDLLARLERAIEQRDEFLAMLGHELRNPLTAILNSIQYLRRAAGTNADAGSSYEIIERQSLHLARLMDDLLDVARVTSGKVTLQRSPLDLRDVARRCVQILAPLLDAHGHDLELSLGEKPLGVDGDPVRIEQMLSNLLTNAIKYTPRGGRIQVQARGEDGQAILSVKDSGVGIDPDTLPHIFDLFAQGPATLERSQGGLGIGLTLVKRLVEMHGGSVEASSEGLGCGSEFTLTFPLLEERARDAAGPEASGPVSKERASRKILIIEDNDDNRNTLRALLACMGHDVDVAQDGMLGIERARAFKPEVALIDIGLPGLNGYRVAEALRTEPWGGGMVLIALTGYGQSEDRKRAFEAGFDAHLVKPVNFENLLSLLDTARNS